MIGEFFEFDPFNFMIGPSAQTLIQSGARYPPCMRNTTAMPPEEQYIYNNNQPDLPDFNNPRQSLCSLQHVCGMGGFLRPSVPDQTFRFITPLFVHAGLVPLLCNIAGLLTIGRSLERVTNAVRMLIIYFVAGTFGHIFGGNFQAYNIDIVAAGSSPAILGLAGCLLVDFVLTWRHITRPKRHFVKLLLITGLCFTMGLMPGVDNVSHVGGFLAGLLIGVICIPPAHGITRRGTLYLWIARFAAFSILITMHIVLSNRFFDRDYHYCPLCRYISCMPLNGSCRLDKT
ncbi:rhomboid-domain-containing protein [Lichtheimia hyalospora FSU 10163]|nr:rhomboid-domain-containing protein [Lichtheimia hyalospora FSU 10163]